MGVGTEGIGKYGRARPSHQGQQQNSSHTSVNLLSECGPVDESTNGNGHPSICSANTHSKAACFVQTDRSALCSGLIIVRTCSMCQCGCVGCSRHGVCS